MATKHGCIQGSNFSYDISCDEVPTFDNDWVGSWAIIEALDDLTDTNDIVVLSSGALALSTDNSCLELRILPADTEVIPVGFYTIVVQVSNSTIGFSQEVMQDSFEIKPQGIA